jgi:thiamine biosynthesis lipoprotein
MGSDAHVIVDGPAPLAAQARSRIDDLERTWSRFIPTSEVSTLNTLAGHKIVVSAATRELVRCALVAYEATGGRFDPTVLGDLVRAGYDRTLEDVRRAPHEGHSELRTGADRIQIVGNTVRIPRDAGFDPGGIGKGLAADIVSRELVDAGARRVCVNLGGDVRVRGGDWTVDVVHPHFGPIARVGIADGAAATSTTVCRHWRLPDGTHRHHLIDPRTGHPTSHELVFATVVAANAWAAEALSKAILIEGRPHHFDVLSTNGAEALVVDTDGNVETTFGFAAYEGVAA